MLWGQAISQADTGVESGVVIDGFEVSAHTHQCDTFTIEERAILSDKLLGALVAANCFVRTRPKG